MQYDKKVRFGGWNHPDYKYVRAKLERFWRSEEEVGWRGKYLEVAHNHLEAGQHRRPTQANKEATD